MPEFENIYDEYAWCITDVLKTISKHRFTDSLYQVIGETLDLCPIGAVLQVKTLGGGIFNNRLYVKVDENSEVPLVNWFAKTFENRFDPGYEIVAQDPAVIAVLQQNKEIPYKHGELKSSDGVANDLLICQKLVKSRNMAIELRQCTQDDFDGFIDALLEQYADSGGLDRQALINAWGAYLLTG